MTTDELPLRVSGEPVTRRRLLGGAAAAALAALPACDRTAPAASAGSAPARAASAVSANVRVSRDRYGDHVGPSLAVNPLNPRELLVACQGSPFTPEFIVTYRSADAGQTWQAGAMPAQPAAGPAGDDVTVAYGGDGRGYVCAARSGHGSNLSPANPDANRAVYVWRTDDAGRSFSAPVTLVAGVYSDHPWIAADQAPKARNVYVGWGGGAAHTALEFTRSTDGGESFELPRTILPQSRTPSLVSAGPQVAAGPDGLVCVVCDWTTSQDRSGDMIGQVTAICSTDGGRTFGAPAHLGAEAASIALPGGARPNSGPAVAAAPRDGSLYVAFPVHRPGSTHSDIVVTTSRDRGRTWSAPVTATPSDGVTYFQPNVAVDAAGRVAVSAFALADGQMNEVLLVSPSGGLRFRPPLRVSAAPLARSTGRRPPRASMASGGLATGRASQ